LVVYAHIHFGVPVFLASMVKSDAQAGIRSQHPVPCPIDLVSARSAGMGKEDRRPGVRMLCLVTRDGGCDRLPVVAVNLAGTWALFSLALQSAGRKPRTRQLWWDRDRCPFRPML
jgi:hypothetical protein